MKDKIIALLGRLDKALDLFSDDFHAFCKDALGYKDMNSEHDALCKFLTGKKLFKLILMPRYTFKSSMATIGYSLWRLTTNPNLKILIYSDSTLKAKGFLNGIKNHIEGKAKDSKFREHFGNWETDPNKGGKWSETEVLISIRNEAHPEPTIVTAGIETSLIGFHFDIIIFDDIVSDKNVTTKEQMDKVAECYYKSLSLLRPGGEVIICGTRWNFGDLYGRIIAENGEREIFDIFIRKAEEKGKLLFDNIGEHSLTRDFLSQQRIQQGSYIYSCLYQNSPVDDKTATFQSSNFSFYGAIKPDDLYVTGTCDPSGEGKDKVGMTVVGTDYEIIMHILEAIQKDMTPSEIIETIINLHYKCRFKIFGLETIFFRKMLRLELERRIREEHTEDPEKFPLFGIHEFDSSSRHGKGKFVRIMALQPYHERGAIKFPGEKLELLKGGFSDLAHQMLHFTPSHMPEPNDVLDSLADHIPLIRKGGVVKKADLPYMSVAWAERQDYEKELGLRRHIPRRYRRPITLPSLS